MGGDEGAAGLALVVTGAALRRLPSMAFGAAMTAKGEGGDCSNGRVMKFEACRGGVVTHRHGINLGARVPRRSSWEAATVDGLRELQASKKRDKEWQRRAGRHPSCRAADEPPDGSSS